MPAEVKGALAVRRALNVFAPDLEEEMYDELGKALKPIAQKARGYVVKPAGLSSWFKESKGTWPKANVSDIVRGIGANVMPSKPNKKGFVSLARLENRSAAGAIMETAGRKNPNGRAPMMSTTLKGAGGVLGTEGTYRYGKKSNQRRSSKAYRSNNPFAGYHFVHALKAASPLASIGRGRKNRGRLIFKAWKADQGKTIGAAAQAIESAKLKFYQRSKIGI